MRKPRTKLNAPSRINEKTVTSESSCGRLMSAHIIYRAFTLPADLVQAVDGPFILAPRNDDQEVHALLSVAALLVLATAFCLAAVTA